MSTIIAQPRKADLKSNIASSREAKIGPMIDPRPKAPVLIDAIIFFSCPWSSTCKSNDY